MKKELISGLYDANKNILVSGDISVGKTKNVMFPLVDEIIDNKDSFLVLDAREEYLSKYYDVLKSKGYNIVIINFNDLEKSNGWNPLEYPYNLYKKGDYDESQDFLDRIGKTLFYKEKNADPFWDNSASDLFTGVTLGLFEDASRDEINLNSVNVIIDGLYDKFAGSDYLTSYFKYKDPSSLSYINASPTIQAPFETKSSIISVARSKIIPYVTRNKLSALLSKTTFSIKDIINKPSAVFVIVRDDGMYPNLIATMLLEQLYFIMNSEKMSNKFNFVLDNFDFISKMNNISDMFGSAIHKNMKFMVVTRDISEFYDMYGTYINKLVNNVYVSDNKIEVKLGDKNEKISNEFLNDNGVKCDVKYPMLNMKDFKVFDLKNYVFEKSKNSFNSANSKFMDDIISENDDKVNELDNDKKSEIKDKKSSLDMLIEELDNKIAELEKEI